MAVHPYCIAGALVLSLSWPATRLSGQALHAGRLLDGLNVPSLKFDEWAQKKKFMPATGQRAGDTAVRVFVYQPEVRKKKPVDSVRRKLVLKEWKDDFELRYQTSSAEEFTRLVEDLRLRGFYSSEEADLLQRPQLFQLRDMTAATFFEKPDSVDFYGISCRVQDFPDPREIQYADDLLAFTSHEYLSFYFGENAVKKDVYEFSPDQRVNCSVLFPNTARQVVFIWKDGVNFRTTEQVLFGSQQQLKNTPYNAAFVAESNWRSKSGLHAGMTLYQLRLLNGTDLRFYGGRSPQSGRVLPEKKGALDFSREQVILGCVNCSDAQFARSEVLQADEAISDGRILFVLSMVILPPGNGHSFSGNGADALVSSK